MLAHRFAGLLPEMTTDEALQSAAIGSLNGRFPMEQWGQRPTCAPHHSASAVALVGGGSPPRPGEISLSHNGILFLDEMPEFPRAALEALREPLETSTITISRATQRAEFSARFQSIAAILQLVFPRLFHLLKFRVNTHTQALPMLEARQYNAVIQHTECNLE